IKHKAHYSSSIMTASTDRSQQISDVVFYRSATSGSHMESFTALPPADLIKSALPLCHQQI
ncbi:hypothetical protein RRG08_058585, partial [Elysia crispata]